VDNNGNVMEQLRWFKPDGGVADAAYFTKHQQPRHRLAHRRQRVRRPASAIYVAYNGWSGLVNFSLPWPGTGKNWYRVTDTATWNAGANTAALPGSEAFIGGEWTSLRPARPRVRFWC
jgi:isoamylase